MDTAVSKATGKPHRFQTIIVMAGICFFAGRACLTDGLEPVGAALIGTLLLYSAEKLECWQKAAIIGSAVIIVQSVWFLMTENVCSISEIIKGGGFAAVFCGIFEVFAGLLGGRKIRAGDDLVLLSLSAVAALVIIGTGLPWLILPALIAISVAGGYAGGVSDGLVCGFASGILLQISGGDPSQILTLSAFAAFSGLFRGSSRLLTGTVIAAAALASMNMEAIPAGIMLMLMPEVLMIKIEAGLRGLRLRNEEDNGKNLRELALLFSSMDNPRSRLAYEFKAMSQLYRQKEQPAKARVRVKPQTASATYSGSFERCGDCCQWEVLPDGKFAIALSDGMGKGEHAARESRLAVTSVIKMLKAGLDPELVLKLLNSILMVDTGQEHFPTMDLGILDQETRELYLYKIGAAPTAIKRKDKVELLTAHAVPMGVMDHTEVPCVSTIVRPGEQVIMMTDGVIDSRRSDLEMEWLREAVMKIKSRDPQTVCDLILREAAAGYADREKDDMTVAVVRVK
ncbi:MAG: SpoIIE family protein phosphatase [Firmicutes bacterium]|nr:SpoIIE family protein phosphatase [Bacillota bacterium]